MGNSDEQQIEDEVEESSGASTLRKFKYTSVFSGENWIPARMGEVIYRSELGADLIFLSPSNDSNATMRLIKSYTHRLGIRASLRQCRVWYEDDSGADVIRRGVVCHIDEHPAAASYKQRMEIAGLDAKRRAQAEELYKLMAEVGLSPETYDFNQPFVDKDGVERHPQDYLLIPEDFPPTGGHLEPPELPDIAKLLPPKRPRGRPKKTEGAEPAQPRVKKTPDLFGGTDTTPKRRPGRPKKQKTEG
jgi:hypothetical protein